MNTCILSRYFGFVLVVSLLCACGGTSNPSPVNDKHFNPSLAQVQKSEFCPKAPAAALPGQDDSPRYDFAQLNQVLQGEGLPGYVHGTMGINQQYLFAFDPSGGVFNIEHMSLSTGDSKIEAILASLKRHDAVRVKGEIKQNDRAMRHIKVDEIEIIQRYETPQDYNHKIDETLFDGRKKVRMIGKVHAVFAGGAGMAFEHEDMILPVIVRPSLTSQTERFFRNDKIVINLDLLKPPFAPIHFYTDESVETPIEVIDSMANCHGHPTTLSGNLLRFLKSPQITTDTYAVRVVDENNIVRNFTFFPDADFGSQDFFDLFTALREKAEKVWQDNAGGAQAARNHQVNAKVKVSAKGKMNIIANDQANPQILIKSVDDLNFEIINE